KPGARPVDAEPNTVVSPCDGIVGACGVIEDGLLFQVKGWRYSTEELLNEKLPTGTYVTIRITPSMYHRFHAPHDLRVKGVTRFSGDAWNVNPIALARVEKLFCKNERALIRTELASGHELRLVPVGAILVASIRLHFAENARLAKGQEMGWFEHG